MGEAQDAFRVRYSLLNQASCYVKQAKLRTGQRLALLIDLQQKDFCRTVADGRQRFCGVDVATVNGDRGSRVVADVAGQRR